MKTCPKCGRPMTEEEAFCPSCGAKYEDPAPQATQSAGFCPSCGQRLEGGAVFCPNCGANVQADAPPAPGQKTKKALSTRAIGMITAGVAALAVIALVFSLMNGVFSSPADRFVSYQRDLLVEEALNQLSSAADQYNGYLSLSTDLTITADTSDSMLRPILRDSAIDLSLNLSKDSLLANGSLTVMGSSVLGGTLSYDKGVVGFHVPELDPIYYTADLETLAVNMGTDPDMAAALKHLALPEISTPTLTKLGKCYIDVVLSAANKNNVTVSDSKKFRLDQLRKNLEGETYVFQPTAEDAEAMLLKLADTIESDKDLRGFVTSFLGSNTQLLSAMGVEIEDELDIALADAADYLRSNAHSMGRNLERSGFTWTLGVSDKKVCLQRLETNGGENVIAYESVPGSRVFYISSYGSLDAMIELDYTQKDGSYTGSMTLSDGYSDLLSMRFRNVDKSTKSVLGCCYGDYTISVDGMEIDLDVSKAADGGSDHVISAYSLGYMAGLYLDDLEITIHTSDKKSSAAKPKATVEDISDYDYQDYYELFGDMEDSMYRIISDIENQFSHSYAPW